MAAEGFRFPQPEFEGGYERPAAVHAPARTVAMEYVDVVVLVAALGLASWLVVKRRSRRALFLLTLFSLLYFGFWRKGCVCSVGSIQNIAQAAGGSGYVVPVSVIAFFLVPLVFALFFGRTFCAAVCPLGAVQDVVIVRPVRVPRWLAQGLGLLAYLYLGMAVLLAVTGAGFLICRTDPFVGFFRLGANASGFLLGGVFLVLGTVVARPYCRFLCPYGVLLRWASRLSWKHLTITPTDCVQCRLCESSCPFGAILVPTPDKTSEGRRTGSRRVGVLLLLLPVWMLVGAGIGRFSHEAVSRVHPTVQLAIQLVQEDAGATETTTLRSEAFRESGRSRRELMREAAAVQGQFRSGMMLVGAFLGVAVGCRLVRVSLRRTRTDYVPDRGECLSCGRCMPTCPMGKDEAKQQREADSA